jgi:hypothetical protein
MTVAQQKGGRYPTCWWKAAMGQQPWINCATLDTEAMLNLADLLEKKRSGK